MSLTAGTGNDAVTINGAATNSLTVDLGSGNNKLVASDLNIATDLAISAARGE